MKRYSIAVGVGLALASIATTAHEDHRQHKADDHAAALGQPGDREKASRTIEVQMSDTMRFVPDHLDVKRGETIRFIVRNGGKVKHELAGC